MNLKSSTVILGVSCLLLSACGENNNSPNQSQQNPQPQPASNDLKKQLAKDNLPIFLAFNGFSDGDNFYDGTPLNLAGDLSAIAPANLYLYDTFIDAVGTTKKPSKASAQEYRRKLPGSGKEISTGKTLLNPELSLNHADETLKGKRKVSPTNPVILSVPAGLAVRPEAPFFPGGTTYTALLAEAPTEPNANHGAIFSIESGGNPLQFAAFAHQQDKTFTLRVYDKDSKIDKSGVRPLLTPAKNPATIRSRFVVLTADGLANNNINLESIDIATLPTFGFKTAKSLIQNVPTMFPQLLDSKNQPIFNDGEHGVFCLGGKNTFNTVDLKDHTFVYPLSAKDKNTTITTLNVVSADSGFITESGKHIQVDTLNGSGTLKLIAVMKGAVTADPIVHVKTLKGVDKVNVVVGIVDPAFKFPFPDAGMPLLSFDSNDLATSLPVMTEDAHMAGAFYDGHAELDGNHVVLKTLTKKARLSSGSSTIRSLMAHHPRTQGISSREMNSLIATLDPMTSVHQTLGGSSAALSQHVLGLQAGSPCSANQYVTSLADHLTVSASNALDHTVASINLNSHLSGFNLATSVYGACTSSQQEVAFGSSITASKPLTFNGTIVTPSIAVGYSMDAFSDKSLSANQININLTNTALNSAFARLMTAFKHEHDGLSTTLAMGLEARHGIFSRGLAYSDHDSVSLAGESVNGMYSVIEASFVSSASRLNITLSNFNHVQIQFGLTD